MKVMAGFAEKRTGKRRGCGRLPAKLEAGQESTKNNSLHVKGNFKSAGVAVSGLSRRLAPQHPQKIVYMT